MKAVRSGRRQRSENNDSGSKNGRLRQIAGKEKNGKEKKGKEHMTEQEYYEQLRIHRSLENPFAMKNGIIVTRLEKGHAVVEMDVDEDKLNVNGTVHGGCLFTMCDMTAGAAANSYGHYVTTVDANMHFLRPAVGVTHLVAENREIKAGKTLIINEVTIRNQDGLEIAVGVFTFMQLEAKCPERIALEASLAEKERKL